MSGRRTTLSLVLGSGALAIAVLLLINATRVTDSTDSALPTDVDDRLKAAVQLSRVGRFTETLEQLQAIPSGSEVDLKVHRLQAEIYSTLGFAFEATRHLRVLLHAQDASLTELAVLAAGGDQLAALDELQRLFDLSEGDPLLRIALNRRRLRQRQSTELPLFADSELPLDSNSPLIRQFLLHQQLRTDTADDETAARHVTKLITELVRDAPDHPQTWLLAGRVAEIRKQHAWAIRCFAEAVKRFPDDPAANRSLANALLAGDESKLAGVFSDQAERLEALRKLARESLVDRADIDRFEKVTMLLLEQRRPEEAVAWSRQAMRLNPSAGWARDVILRKPKTPDRPSLIAEYDSLLTEFEIPDFSFPAKSKDVLPSTIRFEDVAENCGLRFRYENGKADDQQGVLMHQFTGGGVGVVDIDADGWPDVWLTQGSEFSDPTVSSSLSDRVFRNHGGSRFLDVTQPARALEYRFSQGVAVGDINNDGFDDVYVANVGPNALFLNMGDGTFAQADMTDQPSVWTISVAIADVNGDSIADLYDVNYVTGESVFTQTCDHGGLQRVCAPTDFSAEQDRLWLGNGNESFRDATQSGGIVRTDGRGMGIVVGDFLRTGHVQLIVANDESANFHFERDSDEPFVLQETGLTRGLAYEQAGSLTGSMGIALGDADNDQHADVFFTNYYAEANTLHVATEAGFYPDRTSSFGLKASSTGVLGFGTQFLDADLDGDQDLFVANGHLDDFSHLGIPCRMPAQLYSNQGNEYQLQGTVGDYFLRPQLGRAVARLDWNRDGRPDLLVSHLEDAVALLSNTTIPLGQSVDISVVGTTAARRPVGGIVSLQSSRGLQSQWLTAGDGYECSNEFTIRFSVPDDEVTVLTLAMPGADAGLMTCQVPGGGRFAIVEGRAQVYRIPR